MASKAKVFTIWPLQEKFSNLWLNIINILCIHEEERLMINYGNR